MDAVSGRIINIVSHYRIASHYHTPTLFTILYNRQGFDRLAPTLEASTFTYKTYTGGLHPTPCLFPTHLGLQTLTHSGWQPWYKCFVMCTGSTKKG